MCARAYRSWRLVILGQFRTPGMKSEVEVVNAARLLLSYHGANLATTTTAKARHSSTVSEANPQK